MRKYAIRRILVAVKVLEAGSVAAVARAGQLARAYGAEVELFHSVEIPPYLDPDAVVGRHPQKLYQQLQQRAQRRLERIAHRLLPGVHATVSVACDSPAYDAIIRRAWKIKADLIVAAHPAARYRSPWLRLAPWLRLTDWELLRLSPLPVLLVRSSRPYRRPRVLVAVDPTHAFAKPAQLDRRILGIGASISEALHGTLYAVHAYPTVPLEILAPGAKTQAVTEDSLRIAQRRAERGAKAHLDALLRDTQVTRSHRYLIAAHPIDAIDRAARDSGSAMVIMGAISRSGLKRILIGNTAERMLDVLPCDVLIVKPLDFQSRVPRASRTFPLTSPVVPF